MVQHLKNQWFGEVFLDFCPRNPGIVELLTDSNHSPSLGCAATWGIPSGCALARGTYFFSTQKQDDWEALIIPFQFDMDFKSVGLEKGRGVFFCDAYFYGRCIQYLKWYHSIVRHVSMRTAFPLNSRVIALSVPHPAPSDRLILSPWGTTQHCVRFCQLFHLQF